MVLLIGGCSFLFGDKIITTRFRAWQRFSLFMPELFYPLSLCLSASPATGQARERDEWSIGWRVGRGRREGRDQGEGRDRRPGREQGVDWDRRTPCGRRALIGPNVYRARFVFSGATPSNVSFFVFVEPGKEMPCKAKVLLCNAWGINSSAPRVSGGGISFQHHSAAPSPCRSGSIRCLKP